MPAGSARNAEGEQEVISQIPIPAHRRAFAAALLAALTIIAAPTVALAQQVVALVDGEPITSLDIEHRAKFIQMSTQKAPARQEVLDGLIDEILEIKEAHRYGIDAPASEVDNAFANVASRMGIDTQKLTQVLASNGSSADTLKHRLRAELAWTNLVRGRYKASLEIRDSDVEAELQLHKPDDKSADVGYEYVMRPIVLVVQHGAPESVFEARKRDADALRARFQSCNDGIAFARALREVAVRDPVTKLSADLPHELRAILDGTEVGHLTPPEQTDDGVQMFALCSKRETKSDTPDKRKIRDEMFQQKFGVQAKRYLARIRRAAMIEYK
jgi:peptidyl-prolyl cis-trans isomerase SurA